MKFFLTSLFIAATAYAATTSNHKQVVVSYPEDTPFSILEDAKDAIIKAGGVITHEFNLIKGFAANAPARILDTLQSLEVHSNILIEEDKTFSINDAEIE